MLASDYSPDAAVAVMRRLSKWSGRSIGERGFSIGVDDVTPDPRLLAAKAAAIASAYQECQVRAPSASHPAASPWWPPGASPPIKIP